MRGARPRNLRIVLGLRISTLHERTRACISPLCYSSVAMGHWYQLTNEGEEAVQVLQMRIEPSQAILIEQLDKLRL